MPGRQGAQGRVLAFGCGPHHSLRFFLDGPSPQSRFFAAMNSGKTAANRDRPRSLRRTNGGHNGLRIWESGELSTPQERAYAKTQAMNQHQRFRFFPQLF